MAIKPCCSIIPVVIRLPVFSRSIATEPELPILQTDIIRSFQIQVADSIQPWEDLHCTTTPQLPAMLLLARAPCTAILPALITWQREENHFMTIPLPQIILRLAIIPCIRI